MRARLSTPFADSRAADLSLAYGLAPLPALGAHQVAVPGGQLELRVLGASHQVVFDLDGIRWSETVACLPGRPGRLPGHRTRDFGPLRARFTARCLRLDPVRLAIRVRAIARRCEAHPGALIGTFPGSPLAITALQVQDRERAGGGAAWLTWHAYPQTGELVRTASVVVPR